MSELMGQMTMFGNDENYKAFTDKFIPAKTTDDCYTPENIYQAIAGWVAKEYGTDPAGFVRPFYPGGDYEYFDYPEGCTVVDNPPFSILQGIVNFYMARGIKFFLFAPGLTLLRRRYDVCHIAPDVAITYENGANVKTGFCTNLEPGVVLRTAPDLHDLVEPINTANERKGKTELPKYAYPDHVATAAMFNRYSKYGIELKIRAEDCRIISALDSQKPFGKSIFGYGLLLSERAAAERAAAERAAAERAAAERAAAERAAAERAAAERA
ncbi:MAG: hypothetical protein IJH38_06250, partial [Clostridia bacterium]|nr:hypothetical protein [Clostridia bacterium]